MLTNQVQRTPRIKPNYPEGELALEDPAKPSGKPTFSWMTIIIPPIGMLAVTIFMATLSHSFIMLISTVSMTSLTLMVSVMNYKSSVNKHRDTNKKLEKKYLNYLFQVRNDLQSAASTQRDAYTYIHPTVQTCAEIVRGRGKQLWERTAIEDDFLNTRVGVGVQPVSLVPTYTPKTKAIDDENPLEEIASKICEEMYFVKDIPVYIPLRNINTLGIYGKRSEVSDFLNAIMVHLTTHQGYDDVRIVSVMQPDDLEHWEWLKWLPHTWDKDRSRRNLATTAYDASNLAEDILPELRKRQETNARSHGLKTLQTPHFVFLVFAPELWDSTEMMKYLLAGNSELGVTSIFISEKIDVALPLNCQVILEIKDGKGMVRKDTSYLLSHLADFFTADSLDKQNSEYFARSLSPLRIKESQNNSYIPPMVTFLESFEVERVEELKILERWHGNQANRTLSTPLGLGAGGKSLLFDMHEKSYGPHGLVAGTTGSGKSELLQSLLLGLAVNYHPHEVAFVLIDYKGGGMANAFLGLPHLVGTITNLGGNQINRALASIKSELLRRQRLFSEADVTNIDSYIVLYRNREVSLPLPHLIIVVDEFAELKSDQPDFMKELVSAARVGRSLGIHLILATQKPAGVVDDQIWSNSRFKLCLKVQTPSDSQEMLKRPEAAEIKEKGRGYLQVGNNELFTLFQSSWSGAPYHTGEITVEVRPEMDIVSLSGERRALIPKQRGDQSSQISELKAVVNHIAAVSAEQSIGEAFQLWLPPLPETLVLTEVLDKDKIWNGERWQPPVDHLTATVGRIDNPSDQAQYNLDINFNLNGHMLVYGSPSSGKTMLIKTIIMSLAMKYDPEYVHFYILDFGTRTLGVFNQLPHLGDIIFPEDEQKLSKLISWLLSQLDERKHKFSQLGISNLVSYCAATGEKVPYIVILLDNYTGFAEAYDDYIMDLAKLVREGGNYGIYFVFAANAVSSYPYRISQNIKQALVYQMADRTDYSSILGRTEGMEPTPTVGRGLLKDGRILEFHTALPVEGSSDDQIAVGIRQISSEMKAVAGDTKPAEISVIPDKLTLADLLERTRKEYPENSGDYLMPVGLDWSTTIPAVIDVKQVSNFIVSYTSQQHVDLNFSSMIQALQESTGQGTMEFHLFDSGFDKLSALKASPALTRYMSTAEEFLELTQSLVEQLQIRKNDARQAYAEAAVPQEFDESSYILSKYPLLVIGMPYLKSAIDLMEDDSLSHLERIARFGGGLGVLLLVGSDPLELSKLQLVTDFVAELIVNGNALLSGGKPNDHISHSAMLESMDYRERNQAMAAGEAILLTGGAMSHLRIITEL